MNKESVIKDFNSTLLDFLQAFTGLCPTSIAAANIDLVKKIIDQKGKENLPIDQFTYYVLKYKPQIDKSDERFFIDNTYEKEAQEVHGLIMVVNEIKNIWCDLHNENKKRVFGYMQVLCYYSEQYFLLVDS